MWRLAVAGLRVSRDSLLYLCLSFSFRSSYRRPKCHFVMHTTRINLPTKYCKKILFTLLCLTLRNTEEGTKNGSTPLLRVCSTIPLKQLQRIFFGFVNPQITFFFSATRKKIWSAHENLTSECLSFASSSLSTSVESPSCAWDSWDSALTSFSRSSIILHLSLYSTTLPCKDCLYCASFAVSNNNYLFLCACYPIKSTIRKVDLLHTWHVTWSLLTRFDCFFWASLEVSTWRSNSDLTLQKRQKIFGNVCQKRGGGPNRVTVIRQHVVSYCFVWQFRVFAICWVCLRPMCHVMM